MNRFLQNSIRGTVALSLACPALAVADVFITHQTTGNGYDGKLTRILDNGQPITTYSNVGGEGVIAVAVGPTGNAYATGFALGYGNFYQFPNAGGPGGFLNDPGLVWQPGGMTVGTDGRLYTLQNIVNGGNPVTTGGIVRFNSQTGAGRQDYLALTTSTSDIFRDITNDASGHFFISQISPSGNRILRTSAGTSAGGVIDAFVTAGTGGLVAPSRLTIGPDGNLFVVDSLQHTVLKYNAVTGAFIGTATAAGSPATIDLWSDLAFVGNDLLVSSGSSIHRYSGDTGAYMGVFANLPGRYITAMASGVPEPTAVVSTGLFAAIALLRRRRVAASE